MKEIERLLGDNKGLLLAEVELNSEDEEFEKPSWVKEEVTFNQKYYNEYIALHPYREWGKKET